jgi:hypothetical protein
MVQPSQGISSLTLNKVGTTLHNVHIGLRPTFIPTSEALKEETKLLGPVPKTRLLLKGPIKSNDMGNRKVLSPSRTFL